MTRYSMVPALALCLTGALGCDRGGGHPSDPPAANAPATTAAVPAAVKVDGAAAKEIFDTRCAACHGTSGKGDGPGAMALNPKPRNYTDKAWQASVTDEQIRKTIVYGGAAVGKSPIMPGSPDLDGKPAVVDGLVQLVRGFGR